ncbi:MAG: ankyrin repeat domain-containing protein [Deltaproteobacteria bacterium]|nr:ankyrin repeat domain-containing protein [Deltaproteobacteria bacterium]
MPGPHRIRYRITSGDWLLLHDADERLHLRRLHFEGRRLVEVQGLASELLPAGADPDVRPSLVEGYSVSFPKSSRAFTRCRQLLEQWQQDGWIVVEHREQVQGGSLLQQTDVELGGVALAAAEASLVQRIRDRWVRQDPEARARRLEGLLEAIEQQDLARARTLLAEHGGDPLDVHFTRAAVRTRDRSLVAMLLDAGGTVDDTSRTHTTLAVAAEADDAAMVTLLLEHGASIDAPGSHYRRALHDAARVGADEAVAVLLERGAAVDLQDRWGRSAIELAAIHGHDAVVERLRPHASDDHRSRAEALRAEGRLRKERVAALDPRTGPLLWAAFRNRPDDVRRLLGAGVCVNAQAPDGRSAFDVAIERGHESLAAMLIEAGADA